MFESVFLQRGRAFLRPLVVARHVAHLAESDGYFLVGHVRLGPNTDGRVAFLRSRAITPIGASTVSFAAEQQLVLQSVQ